MRDLIIIGAGPAGLAAAREAAARGLDFVVLERGIIADTISQFPIAKLLFSTPNELELTPGGLACKAPKPTREELLTHYTRFVVDNKIPVHTREPVTSIVREAEGFRVETTVRAYYSRTVLVATGINGVTKLLGVPGESPERVQYRFVEGFPYAAQDVLVVGSGNSAAEAAIYLEEVGARVTLAMRRTGFEKDPETGKAEIKWWVREPLQALADAGRMRILFKTRVVSLGEETATIESPDLGRVEVPCRAVFALLGTSPDLRLLVGAGAEIGDDGVPVYDPQTFETAVPGLFVAGHITRERHIKGALEVAPRVVEEISRTLTLAGS